MMLLWWVVFPPSCCLKPSMTYLLWNLLKANSFLAHLGPFGKMWNLSRCLAKLTLIKLCVLTKKAKKLLGIQLSRKLALIILMRFWGLIKFLLPVIYVSMKVETFQNLVNTCFCIYVWRYFINCEMNTILKVDYVN